MKFSPTMSVLRGKSVCPSSISTPASWNWSSADNPDSNLAHKECGGAINCACVDGRNQLRRHISSSQVDRCRQGSADGYHPSPASYVQLAKLFWGAIKN